MIGVPLSLVNRGTLCYLSGMKKPSKYEAQQRYQAKKAAEYVQVNVKFKSAADVKMFKKLRDRFEGESDSGIVRLAVRELASRKNK